MREIIHQDLAHSTLFLVDPLREVFIDRLDFFPVVTKDNRVLWKRSDVREGIVFPFTRHAAGQQTHLTGGNLDLQKIWNEGVAGVDVIEDADFSYFSNFNCRSAAIFCLKKMGFEYIQPEGVIRANGANFDFSLLEKSL